VRFIAIILLIIFSAFTTEQVLLPSNCFEQKTSSKQGTCKMKGDKKMCCMNKMKSKETKNSKNSRQCPDCPLTILMIYQRTDPLQPNVTIVKTQYTAFQTSALSDYFNRRLKPPDFYLFFG
jgi:hypothetical protein